MSLVLIRWSIIYQLIWANLTVYQNSWKCWFHLPCGCGHVFLTAAINHGNLLITAFRCCCLYRPPEWINSHKKVYRDTFSSKYSQVPHKLPVGIRYVSPCVYKVWLTLTVFIDRFWIVLRYIGPCYNNIYRQIPNIRRHPIHKLKCLSSRFAVVSPIEAKC